MKIFIFIILIALQMVSFASRLKPYDLPAGASEVLIAPLRRTFVCTKDGYYADQDNNCQVFHVCHTSVFPGGSTRMLQYSFFCGNLTIFNQRTLTCTYPENSVPCSRAHDYYKVNENIWYGSIPSHIYDGVRTATGGRQSDLPRPLSLNQVNEDIRYGSISSQTPDGGQTASGGRQSDSPRPVSPNKPPQPKKSDKKKKTRVTDKSKKYEGLDENKIPSGPQKGSVSPDLPENGVIVTRIGNKVITTRIEYRDHNNATYNVTENKEYHPNAT